MGFFKSFKKIFKKVKKFAIPAAATLLLPGVGTAVSGALGSVGSGLLGKGLTFAAKQAAGALISAGASKLLGGSKSAPTIKQARSDLKIPTPVIPSTPAQAAQARRKTGGARVIIGSDAVKAQRVSGRGTKQTTQTTGDLIGSLGGSGINI